MNQELFVAYSGMRSREQALEVLANNLANTGVAGYKKDQVQFGLYDQVAQTTADAFEKTNTTNVEAKGTAIDFSTGSLTPTGNPLDLALAGEGFFVVETPRGIRYTRNGHFRLSPQGDLVTQDGCSVLGQNGKLRLPPGNVQVSSGGEVSVDGVMTGKLKVVDFDDLTQLSKQGGSCFVAPPGTPEVPPKRLDVKQNYLEEANVQPVQMMTEMITVLRSFDLLNRALRSITDGADRKVIDEIGNV